MRVNEINKQINFKNQKISKDKKENIALIVCGSMVLSPLIPIIDGDSFRDTYGNKNIAKYVTGLAAIGGVISGALLLGKKIPWRRKSNYFQDFSFCCNISFFTAN